MQEDLWILCGYYIWQLVARDLASPARVTAGRETTAPSRVPTFLRHLW